MCQAFHLQLLQEVWTVLTKFPPEEPRCLTEQQLSYSQRLKLSGVHSRQQSQKKTEGGQAAGVQVLHGTATSVQLFSNLLDDFITQKRNPDPSVPIRAENGLACPLYGPLLQSTSVFPLLCLPTAPAE